MKNNAAAKPIDMDMEPMASHLYMSTCFSILVNESSKLLNGASQLVALVSNLPIDCVNIDCCFSTVCKLALKNSVAVPVSVKLLCKVCICSPCLSDELRIFL